MITVNQEIVAITAKVESKQIVCEQITPQIIVQGGQFVVSILPFTFTCTIQGQTSFGPLPSSPTALICVFITGAGQNIKAGDVTVNGLYLVTSSGLNIGDTFYGAYEV